jgi:hypothetical protein
MERYIRSCDYYITKVLQLYYNDNNDNNYNNDNKYEEIELKREKGYYCYDLYDEDEENYEEMINDYKNSILIPQAKPIILYMNGNFNKPASEEKYKPRIDYELISMKKKWSDITKIIKVEKRFAR